MNFLKVGDILKKLDTCIRFKKPFSHIRFGDGGIKFIHSILYRDVEQLNLIVEKEGLPPTRLLEIFELWGYYSRRADCIDTPQVYFDGSFWPRIKKPGKPINSETEYKMRIWKDLYSRAEMDHDTYCNPESNCLMIVDIPEQNTIFDIMKNRKICVITACPQVKSVLPEYDIDIVPIVGQWENQYKNSFKDVVEYINKTASYYDFWLIAAGELGRLYSGMIKEKGGRCIDMGFVIEYWLNGYIHPRFKIYLRESLNDHRLLRLTQEGKKYISTI